MSKASSESDEVVTDNMAKVAVRNYREAAEGFKGIADKFTELHSEITKLQDSGGPLGPNDQPQLDKIASLSGVIASNLSKLDLPPLPTN